jgi:hypothetical protein
MSVIGLHLWETGTPYCWDFLRYRVDHSSELIQRKMVRMEHFSPNSVPLLLKVTPEGIPLSQPSGLQYNLVLLKKTLKQKKRNGNK